jgi:glutaredoxin
LKGQDLAEVVEEVSKLNPDRTFPTLVIDGDEVLIGFKEDAFKEKIL